MTRGTHVRSASVMAALVPLLTIAVLMLESGLMGATRAVYQAPPSAPGIDLDAVAEIGHLGIDLCAEQVPTLPATLAGRVAVTCEPIDGHGGIEYVAGMSLIAVVGAWIVARFGNPVGTLLTAAVTFDAAGALTGAYALRAMQDGWPGTVPAGLASAVVPIGLIVLLVPAVLLHVPNGHLPSPRWRWVLRAAATLALLLTVVTLTHPLVVGSAINPIGAPWDVETADDLLGIGWSGWMLVLVVAIGSLFWRLVSRWLGSRHQDPPDTAGTPAVASHRGSGR